MNLNNTHRLSRVDGASAYADEGTFPNDLPHVSAAVPPHDDWETWKRADIARINELAHTPKGESKATQRRELTSAGLIFGALGFLLHTLAYLPAAQASTGNPSTMAISTMPMSQVPQAPVVVKTVPPIIQAMSAIGPQERRFDTRYTHQRRVTRIASR